ncbi:MULTISPECIES: type I secretion protein [unclassified Ensifer]|uniref:type I secretion protein n=1 Tax=unclassified Ensifer TaxID=2633371 RepID=UPI000A6B58D2|nr:MULTISPECIES: type I secretion protein [unclassified Ensifer]
MYSAKITEAIAHFIGLFELTTEEARLREIHEKFDPDREVHKDPKELVSAPVKVQAPYDLDDFNPDVPYKPLGPDIYMPTPDGYAGIAFPEYPISGGFLNRGIAESVLQGGSARTAVQPGTPQINPPGSVVVHSTQTAELSDNDLINVGGHGLESSLRIDNSATMAELIDAAQEISLLGNTDVAGSSDAIASLVVTAAERLDAYAASDEAQGSGIAVSSFVAKASALDGIYVNGVLVEEAPALKDHLPNQDETPDTPDEPEASNGPKDAVGGVAHGEGAVSIDVSVELVTGSNTLANSVVVTSNWLQAEVLAVAGDHVELNAIIQTNVYYDSDLVSSALSGGGTLEQEATQAFNIAMFKHIEPSATETAQADTGIFPSAWAITEVKGDLMMVNWLQQFAFMSDQDTAILSASGSKLSIVAGDNTSANEVSLLELGYRYDLIFVGGSVFDANIIQQTNILLDNDLIGAVGGFQTSGAGSVSTGGNLLWNYAGIVEAGAGSKVGPMSEGYLSALQDLSEGKKPSFGDFLHDPAFAGLHGLRVLYISGDLISLNYIQQTNILGDSDQVTLAMNALTAHPDADWTISTGSNALLNYAGIVDVDTGKTIFAGGGAYSDEVLIQAELIKNDPYLGSQNPDALVSEAVVFLGDDMLTADTGNLPQDQISPNPGLHTIETASADPMHSMVA